MMVPGIGRVTMTILVSVIKKRKVRVFTLAPVALNHILYLPQDVLLHIDTHKNYDILF